MTLAEEFNKKENVVSLRVIEGGKGTDDNWLKDLETGTCFWCMIKDHSTFLIHQYIKIYQLDLATVLVDNTTMAMQEIRVHSPDFSKKYYLYRILGRQLPNNNKEEENGTAGECDRVLPGAGLPVHAGPEETGPVV